jgi:prephenate dehydratase
MYSKKKILVQGYAGCFHEEAAIKYFGSSALAIVESDTFPALAKALVENSHDHLAIMAIENSIAGSLLQNYRILRENKFRIVGEVFLRIRHNLMALPGQSLVDITEVHSHPMALNQCIEYLQKHPQLKLVEASDTALCAKQIRESTSTNIAAIASKRAAELYGLEVLAAGIETSQVNYTRFFIIQGHDQPIPKGDFDKASIYFIVNHAKGSLLKVIEQVYKEDINISKLQSYPVLGSLNTYYFHLDLEFDSVDRFYALQESLKSCTVINEVLGLYKRDIAYDN